MRDSLTKHDVEFGLTEWRRHLVLHHLHTHLITLDVVAVFQLTDTTDIQTDRGIELQGVTTGCCLGVTKHHTDLIAQLVDKDTGCISLVDRTGQLTQRLRHQTSLQAHLAVAHIAFDLGFRCQGCHRVDHNDVNRRRTDQLIGNLKCLLSVVGLRDPQVLYIHT